MLKDHWRVVSRIERFSDNIIIIIAFFATYYWRDDFVGAFERFVAPLPETNGVLGPVNDYLIVLGISIPLYNSFLSLLGGYHSMRFSSSWRLARTALFSSILVFFSIGSFLYLLKLDLSRSFVGLFCLVTGLFLLAERYLVWKMLRAARTRGKNYRNVLIVGTGVNARRLYQAIVKQPEFGVRVIGFVEIGGSFAREEALAVNAPGFTHGERSYGGGDVYDLPARIIATDETFEAALKRHAIDEVFISNAGDGFGVVSALARIAAEEGVRVSLAADLFSLKILRSELSYFGDIPLIHYNVTSADDMALLIKRALDILVSGALLAVLSPVFVAIGLMIKLDSKGPILFEQRRMGLNGRIFTLLKFRSMVLDAESQRESLMDRNEMDGPAFKIAEDPRVTRVGRVLRRYSLDELPQLWNVFVGEMSLVGPRPPIPDEVSLYERKHRRRLSMRPGITCTWQVSGRNAHPSFDRWAELDLEYIDNWSLLSDLKLMLRTIPAVLGGYGAS